MSREITRDLWLWRSGDLTARDEVIELVYSELKRRASSLLRRERKGHTLSPTSLVHEAYLRLTSQQVDWMNRDQFFGVASTLMRRILVDHARRRLASKRRLELAGLDTAEPGVLPLASIDLIALDSALDALAGRGPRQARLVELRYFTGLSLDEAAAVLGISPATASRDWLLARAWLLRRLRAAS